MKKAFLLSLALPFSLAFAAAAPAQAGSDAVGRLRDAALQDRVALDLIEGLTTEVGPRLAGTEQEARARSWAVARLKALGFSNVHVEDYRMPVWVRGAETAEVVSPFPQKLALTALGNSGSTGSNGVTAAVVELEGLEAVRAAPEGSLRGKIAFITHAMQATQDGSSYGANRPIRSDGPALAASKGAVAVLIRSIGTDHHRVPHAGLTTVPAGTKAVPAAALSVPDADNLHRMIARGQPVVVHLVLTPATLGERTSGNVVAEVPGSDPKAGIILIGGHLDSWDLGTGAIDDAAGVAITAAAAKHLLDAPGRPRRTVRVVWWGSEEVGGFGSDAYFERHQKENVVLAGESDFGADRVWRFLPGVADSNRPLADAIADALRPLGIASGKGKPDGGADVEKWGGAGVALFDLNQDGMRYFDLHHTADDTFDKVDPEQLRQNVAAWTALLAVAANAPEPIERIANP